MKKQNVIIPAKHFLVEAKNEYWDYQSKLICEVLQNSFDAGSSRIDLNFHENEMEFIDNGCGMSKNTLVSAMLTLGGSKKEEGNTGGFGAAKKILLFSHESYEIHTLDNHVKGEVLSYSFINSEFYQGTKIKIKPYKEFNYNRNMMAYYAKEFLKKCNFENCQVYIDGELFNNYLSLPKVRETELMSVYSDDSNRTGNNVYVSKNGLFMFSRYVTSLNQAVVCDIKINSKKAFSQSRDSLKGAAAQEFDALVDELNIDKMSFKTKGIRKRLFRGIKSFVSFVQKITSKESTILNKIEQEQLKEVMAKIDFDKSVEEKGLENTFEEVKKYNIVEDNVLEKVKKEYHKEEKAEINYDFLIDLHNSEYNEIPEEYHPETMGFENTQIALLWKHCILEIIRIQNYSLDFTIGFTLSKFNEALCYKEKGIQYLLINPEILKEKYNSLDERFYKTLLVACHELIHVFGKRYHDEEFASMFEEVVTKVMINIDKNKVWSKVEEDNL